MEFYVVALIFIACMIVLALLIYYFQERKNLKYSFNENQRAITSIALSVGVPEVALKNKMSPRRKDSDVPIEIIRAYQKQQSELQKRYLPGGSSSVKIKDGIPFLDEMSDSDTSNSEKIYFPQRTAAYSYARKASMSAAYVKAENSRLPPHKHQGVRKPSIPEVSSDSESESLEDQEPKQVSIEESKKRVNFKSQQPETKSESKPSSKPRRIVRQYSSSFLSDDSSKSSTPNEDTKKDQSKKYEVTIVIEDEAGLKTKNETNSSESNLRT